MEKEKESKNILPNFLDKLSLKQRDQLKIKIPKNNTDKNNTDKNTTDKNNTDKNNTDKNIYKLSLKQRQQLGIRFLP